PRDAPSGASTKAAEKEAKPNWQGVDETVVEKVAREAGRPPREPFINTDQGDLLLFCFLVAGVIGGFVAGYCFRGLFPPRRREKDGKAPEDTKVNV
ncbi:MAG: hypothetical protein ABSE73_20460, partial [Planctomycetota bacterium]